MKKMYTKTILIVSALLIAASSSVTAAPSGVRGNGDLNAAKMAKKKYDKEIMSVKGVVGNAIGLDDNKKAQIVVFLENASGGKDIKAQYDGVTTKKVVTGPFNALPKPPGKPGGGGGGGGGGSSCPSDYTVRFDPGTPGCSTGHPLITAGTLGAIVQSGSTNYILSNNHVLANCNSARRGDSILQPGTFDHGSAPGDIIATLSEWKDIDFSNPNDCDCTSTPPSASCNDIDAAIAELLPISAGGRAVEFEACEIPYLETVPADAVLRLKVQKVGRTTGLTSGQVSYIDATVNVGYGSSGVARYCNQLVIKPGSFSAGGDSGSLIVAKDAMGHSVARGQPIGLLFAGNARYTIANPIEPVLSHFGVSILNIP